MDIVALTFAVTKMLTPLLPYLFKAGDKVADEAGKLVAGETWEWAKGLWARVWPKVETKQSALEAAKDVARAPDDEDAQAALRVQFKKLLSEDEALAREVSQWLEKAQAAGINVSASGDGSVAIGGDVSGSIVNTGTGNAISGGISLKGDGNVIGNSNTVSVAKTTATYGVTSDDLVAVVSQMSELLRSANLNEDDRDTIETNLRTVEREVKNDKPRLPLIESSLKSVESLVKSTESIRSVAVKLLPTITKAVEYAKELFS